MNWLKVQLGEIARIVGGSTPRREEEEFWNGNIPWVTPTDLSMPGKQIDLVKDTNNYITEKGLASSSIQILPVGTVLFSSRATIGKVGISQVPLTTNQGFTNFVPKNIIDSKFLAYVLMFNLKNIEKLAGSTTFKEVTKTAIRKYEILLPPPKEQQQIVKILDQADELRRKRVEADHKAERILPSLFIKMFGDPTTNPKNFNKEKLGELIKVKSGNFLPAKSMDADGTHPVYGGNGINGYHSQFMFKNSVIVIGRVGAYCGVIHYTEPKSWVTDNALYISWFDKRLTERYLIAALQYVNLNQYAGRAGQPLISGSRIYPIEILVPPDSLQTKFSELVEQVKAIVASMLNTKTNLEATFELLLQRAFSGELTAKWREAHLKELLEEMEIQRRELDLSDSKVATLF